MVKPVLFVSLALSSACFAQQSPNLSGTYNGVLTRHRFILHLSNQAGVLACTVDTPDQNMNSLPCTSVTLNGQTLSFNVPSIRGAWTGFITNDGGTLAGNWNQNFVYQLNFAREMPGSATSAMAKPSDQGQSSGYVFRFDPSGKSGMVYRNGSIVGRIASIKGQALITALGYNDGASMQAAYAAYASSPEGVAAGALPLFRPGGSQ